jgi:hypothetical protein
MERGHKTMAQVRGADESENGDHHEQQRIDRHKPVPAKSYNKLIDSVISRFPDNSIGQSKWTGLSLPLVDCGEKILNALQHDYSHSIPLLPAEEWIEPSTDRRPPKAVRQERMAKLSAERV